MDEGSNRRVFLREIKNFRVKLLFFKQPVKLYPLILLAKLANSDGYF